MSFLNWFCVCFCVHCSRRCAINWIVEADLRGPASPVCRQLACLHDLCLKNRKQGYQLFKTEGHGGAVHGSDLAIPSYPLLCPHYLNAVGGKAKPSSSFSSSSSSLSSKSYHSTSVLGRLFDYSQSALMEVEKTLRRASSAPPPVAAAVVLDPDFNFDTICTSGHDTGMISSGKKHQFLQAAADLITR
jgi:hypothetical protein